MTTDSAHGSPSQDRIAGTLLGLALGDALGLPCEGLCPRRIARLLGSRPLRHRFILGRGMVSDDTEHACFTGLAMLEAPDDPERFARALARRLRWWSAAIPAGIGWATLRACLKLWVGVPPSRSGVWSAGNGPAMRAPILGVCLGHDPARMDAYLRASTRLTHSDPRAERAARLAACAAWHGARRGPDGLRPEEFFAAARAGNASMDPEWEVWLQGLKEHLARGSSVSAWAAAHGLDNGVSGYAYHTVPAAVYAWLRHPGRFREAVSEVVALGGDTDTTAAITGALCGATSGAAALPEDWLAGLWEWPRGADWMHALAECLASTFDAHAPQPRAPPPYFWPGIIPRNALFLILVLGHGLRRLAPPY